MIDPATQAEILRLHFVEKLSLRAISCRFGVHRQTVTALIQRRKVLLNKNGGKKRVSILAPYYERIDKLLRDDPGRSSINILQKLRDAGYQGGVTVLKDYLSTCRVTSEPKAYLSLEFLPGQAAQVDWGDFGYPFGLGRKLWCFVMVLCWSRLLYLEFTLSACFESFIRCHEHAFEYFGGIPKEIWYDNLATAVAERKHKIIRFNPKFSAYCGAHHFKPVACNRGAGHEKGRVEDGVRYVRHNFWPGRTFIDFQDTNIQLNSWQENYANKRTHASTGKIPELQFIQEKPCLLPLASNYDTDEIRSLKASHQFRVSFDSNEYSVPWRLSGRILTLRADTTTVRIYLNTKRICTHTRCWERKKSIVNPKHQEGLLERKPGAQTTSDIAAVKALGPNGCRYLEFIAVQNRSIRTELNHLMVLITVYGPQALESCIAKALKSGIIGSHHLERLLIQSENSVNTNPEPLH
ncbi:MAG: IS21 family transposase, partial [Candidatus Anammoxibacter sp.]